jgi:hypothetical protein
MVAWTGITYDIRTADVACYTIANRHTLQQAVTDTIMAEIDEAKENSGASAKGAVFKVGEQTICCRYEQTKLMVFKLHAMGRAFR